MPRTARLHRPALALACAAALSLGTAAPAPEGPDAPFQIARVQRIAVSADERGHFYVDARIKRPAPSYTLVDVAFMVDTGATYVMLAAGDAKRAGYKRSQLDFDRQVMTGNGVIEVAAVVLPEVRVGKLRMRDVEAYVMSRDDGISVLGNSFLRRLSGYRVSDDELVMEW